MYPFIFTIRRNSKVCRQEVVYGNDRTQAEQFFYEMHDFDFKKEKVSCDPVLVRERTYA